MKSTILEGLSTWGAWQPDRRIDFNGFHWRRPDGGVLIDPMALSDDRLERLVELGGARWTLVTNADHLRAAPELRERLGAEIWAPAGDRERFGEHAEHVDGWFKSASDLPASLRSDVEVHAIRGGKSPVEIAFHLRPLRALLFGDVVRSHESGVLRLLPDPKIANRERVVSDLRPLAELDVEAVLLGDGDSLFVGGGHAFRAFVAGLR